MKPIKIPPRQEWNSGIKQPIIQREFRGVNKDDPFSINDVYATDIINTDPSEYPVLATRPGYSVLGSVSRVLGIGVWKDTELLSAFDDGSIMRWNGSSFDSVTTGLDTSAPWSFCNFKGGFSDIYLLAANGVQVKRYDGSSVSDLSGVPAGLNFIEQYADRVWGVVGNTIHASGYRNATDWTSTSTDATDDSVSFYAEIETPDGEKISALKAGLGQLVIFKPSAIYRLRGYAPSSYEVTPISTDIGAINNQCVTVIGGGMYFLSKKGIYVYRGDGVAPTKTFSKPVQYYIDNMNQDAIQTYSVGTDGELLYVSISMSSGTQPDTMLAYDPGNGTWSVWNGFSTVCFANMGTNTYLGCYDGSVRKLGGYTDAGAAIWGKWVTKPLTAQSMAQTIRMITLWATVHLGADSGFKIYLSPSAFGDSDWIQVGSTITGSDTMERQPYPVPSTITAPTDQIRLKLEWYGQVKIYELSRNEDYKELR